jgi:hypothetical protein
MVNLSAGELGGTVVDGTGWDIGEEMVIEGLIYRRISEDQAVYCGAE